MFFYYLLLCRPLLIYLVRFDYSISFLILFFSHFLYFYFTCFYLLAFKFREAVRYLPYGACPVVGVNSGLILEYPSPFGGAITDAPSSKTGQTLLRGNVTRNGKRPSLKTLKNILFIWDMKNILPLSTQKNILFIWDEIWRIFFIYQHWRTFFLFICTVKKCSSGYHVSSFSLLPHTNPVTTDLSIKY